MANVSTTKDARGLELRDHDILIALQRGAAFMLTHHKETRAVALEKLGLVASRSAIYAIRGGVTTFRKAYSLTAEGRAALPKEARASW